MKRHLVCLSAIALVLAAGAAIADDEYRLDDGTGDNIGVTGGSTSKATAWLNGFVVEPGFETLTGINIAFGSIPANTPATAYLWGDLNNDGDPSDAFVIASVTDAITNPNFLQSTNAFQTFDIPDQTLTVGESFFAGVVVNDYAQGDQPARIDFNGTDSIPNFPPSDHSWIASETDPVTATVDPNNLTAAQLALELVDPALGQDGTWLVRVNAIPEPGTLAVALLGAAAALRRPQP